MGGRGSISVSGKRLVSRLSVQVIDSMSLNDVDRSLGAVERRMSVLSEITARTAEGKTGYDSGAPWGSKSDYDEFKAAHKEIQQLQGTRSLLLKRQQYIRSSNNSQDASRKTFVNSYGEATTRYITSNSYEREQRRQERQIDLMFSRR